MAVVASARRTVQLVRLEISANHTSNASAIGVGLKASAHGASVLAWYELEIQEDWVHGNIESDQCTIW
jgi:hypothetical protein